MSLAPQPTQEAASQTIGPHLLSFGSETKAVPVPAHRRKESRPSSPACAAQAPLTVQPTAISPGAELLGGCACVSSSDATCVPPVVPQQKAVLPSVAGVGPAPQGRTAYLSLGEAQHGLHHGHALPVLQRVEGAVVLKGREVLFPPGSCHLLHHLRLHLLR